MPAHRSDRDGDSASDSRHSSQGLPSPDQSVESDSELPSRTQSGSQAEPTRFEFVDVSSTNARKQARAHVMREFMRQRRRERNEGVDVPPTVKVEKRASGPSEFMSKPAKSRATRERGPKDSPMLTAARKGSVPRARTASPVPKISTALQGPAFPPALALAERKGIVKMQTPTISLYQSPEEDKSGVLRRESLGPIPPRSPTRSPRPISDSIPSVLSTGEGILQQPEPVMLDEEDVPLVEHYLNVVPELVFDFRGANLRSNTGLNPARDIIVPLSMNDPIAFQATSLAFGAGHLARLQGRKDSPQSIKHRVQALQRLRGHFFGAKKQSQDFDVMIAMLSLALCEDRFGDSRAAWIHMRAAISLLPNLLAETNYLQDRRLNAYLNYVLITLSDHDSCALKPLLPTPFSSPSSHHPQSDTSLATSNLLSFLRLLHATPPVSPQNSAWPLPVPRRYLAFTPSSPLYTLLHPRHPPASPEEAHALLASQIYLTSALLQLSSSESATDAFLKTLTMHIVEHDLDVSPSIQPLLWLLLYHSPTASLTSPAKTACSCPCPPSSSHGHTSYCEKNPSYDAASTSLFTSQSVNVLKRTGDIVWRQSVGRVCVDWLSGRDGWNRSGSNNIEMGLGMVGMEASDGFEGWMEGLRREIETGSGDEGVLG